jgi:hypothetical protein
MSNRNRSEGWVHAKISGHINETELVNYLLNCKEYQLDFLRKVGCDKKIIRTINTGGISQGSVRCILDSGGVTKSKTDIVILFMDNSRLNVSLKKSYGGQVFLITPSRFILGFEKQFRKKIPQDIVEGIYLFWGYKDSIEKVRKRIKFLSEYELRKRRIVSETLARYDSNIHDNLLNWFSINEKEIFEFCFSRGLTADTNEWADILWYKNFSGENNLDDVFIIEDLKKKIHGSSQYGTVGGGTTIQLSFGFVQWHQNSMQFHHNYQKINEIHMKSAR